MSNKQELRQLACPECNSNNIIRVEYVEALVYHEYSTNYEGEAVDSLDRYTEEQGSIRVTYECSDCKNFDSEIEVFQQ